MIIYNVTINIEHDVSAQWVQWMKEVHIPEVMATGCFTEYKMCKILVNEEQGISYSVQYTALSMADYERYKSSFASALQQKTASLFANKYVSFRTLLEII